MKKYKNNKKPEFLNEIDIFEVTDPAHADVLNIPLKQIYENTMVNRLKLAEVKQWKAVTKGDTWSRICSIRADNGYKGYRGILSLSAVRDQVSYGAVFLVSAGVNAVTHVVQVGGSDTSFRYRILAKAGSDVLFDLYDSAAGITNASTQEWDCCFVPLSGMGEGSITIVTSVQDDSIMPDGYSVVVDKNTGNGNVVVADRLIGTLDGTAAMAERLNTPYAASDAVGGAATSLAYKHVINTVVSGVNLKVYYSDGTSVSHALPFSSGNKINGSGAVEAACTNNENYVYVVLNEPLIIGWKYLITNIDVHGFPIQYANSPDYFVITDGVGRERTIRALNDMRKVPEFLMTYNASGITISEKGV